MEILIGTTNHSKVKRITELLADTDIQLLTLTDIEVAVGHELGDPDEVGATPEENARIKVAYYRQYHEPVICQDSGLYFNELPLDDPRQPGLNIRTPNGRKRLSDDEMIEYYSNLVESLGGQVSLLSRRLRGLARWQYNLIYGEQRDDSTRLVLYGLDPVKAASRGLAARLIVAKQKLTHLFCRDRQQQIRRHRRHGQARRIPEAAVRIFTHSIGH